MRRLMLVGISMLFAALLALFGGLVYASAQAPPELIPAGAGDVRVERTGLGRQRITYMLPAGTTATDMLRYYQRHGWRRRQLLEESESQRIFVRIVTNGGLREFMTFSRPLARGQPVTISLIRCLRWNDRMFCP